MKNTFTVILSGLFLCGCSQKQATPASHTIDLVQAGTNELWKLSDNRDIILSVTKRDGNSLEGVRLSHIAPDGHKSISTADTGTVASGSVENPTDENSVRIILHNARVANGKMTYFTSGDVTFLLHK